MFIHNTHKAVCIIELSFFARLEAESVACFRHFPRFSPPLSSLRPAGGSAIACFGLAEKLGRSRDRPIPRGFPMRPECFDATRKKK